MKRYSKNKLFMVLGILFCTICLLELLFFLALFVGLVGSMGILTLKGIFIHEFSYALFLISFILFFLFLSVKKGKRILLIFSVIIFIGATAEKCRTMVKIYANKSKVNGFYFAMNSKFNNSLKSDSLFIIHQTRSFEDHFENGLEENWLTQYFSFYENGCEMLPSQVNYKNSIVTLTVDKNNYSGMKPFVGGEIGSYSPFLYGKFTVRMKNQILPGTVSSFFLMNKWKLENWEHKEIDIEFLGRNTSAVQFTVHHFKQGGKIHISNKHTHLLGFDSSSDFHDYTIVWSWDSITFLVDGKWVHSVKDVLIDEKMYIRLNHWTTDKSRNNYATRNWLGPIDPDSLPSRVYYDFVRYNPLK